MPFLMRPIGPILVLLASLGACAQPQGAALVSQVLSGSESPDAAFGVRYVTRDTLPGFASWPKVEVPDATVGWIAKADGSSDQIIEAGDKIGVGIWSNEDGSLLTSPGQKALELPGMLVSPKGTIFLPYVGEIYVAKMSPDEARQAIQDKLKSIIPSAQVLINHESGRKNSVDLVSGVPRPGPYPLTDRGTTVLNLISLGGGVGGGDPNPQVRLSRGGKLYGIGLTTLLKHPELDTTLRGGDKVFVEPDPRYFLSLGEAGRDAQVRFSQENLTALDAMSIIGGLNPSTANPKGILILRNYPESAVRSDGKGPEKDRMIFAFDLTTADGLFSAGEFDVQHRDLVLVTQSSLLNVRSIVSLFSQSLTLANSIQNF